MNEIPHNTLPNEQQLRLTIRPWWRGGGTTNLIVHVCRRMECDLTEALTVAERIADQCEGGLKFVTDSYVEQQVEMVRASESRKIQKALRLTSDDDAFDPGRCVFSDEFNCPQCTRINGEPWKHGRTLEGPELAQFFADFRQYVADVAAEAIL